jgi:5-methylcytosine-specific restriction enzyme subunit McrC
MLKTIRVFEHETLIVGRPVRTVDGSRRSLTLKEFNALVRYNERRDELAFDVGHKRLKFRQFVGYIQVGDLGIEILPKADRGGNGSESRAQWHDALIEMLRVAGRLGKTSLSNAVVSLRQESLLEVFVAVFLNEVEGLLHEGLARAYRTVEENGNCYRGRLLVSNHIRANLVHAERFFVTRQAYDLESVPNRILRTALSALTHSNLSDPTRRRRDKVYGAFPEVPTGVFQQSDFDRLRLTRNTVRYKGALDLARLILLDYSPQLRSGRSDVFSLLFDMNQLWEEYFAAVMKRVVPADVLVDTQESRTFWSAPGQNRTLRPDILLRRRSSGELVANVDTKWKLPKQGRPADSDLKQMFAYNELFGSTRAFLIYPSGIEGKQGVTGGFHVGGHSCETRFFWMSPAKSGGFTGVTSRLGVEVESWIVGLLAQKVVG